MAIVEIRCPHCGSSSVSKDEKTHEYCCNYCETRFQLVVTSKKDVSPSGETETKEQIRYGKVEVKPEEAQKLGRFVLEKNVNVAYNLFQVFNFQLFKQISRGNNVVRANVFGYAFTNPMNGIINHVFSGENKYPLPEDFKDGSMRECVRLINDSTFEEKPSIQKEGQILQTPSLVSLKKLQSDVFSWITQSLVFRKSYMVQSSRSFDSGAREVKFTFKKKDVVQFGSLGCIAVPLFHFTYKHPSSTKPFIRDVLGYSGEVVKDDLVCSKTKFLGRVCDTFPEEICSACENPICNEHLKLCEKCGAILCKDCITSKGIVSKHYYCPKCA